jgi:PAS domain-containing protein
MNIQADSKSGRKSWLVDSDQTPKKAPPDLAMQIINIMEQGIIVWSADGVCELHNTRIFGVLELSGGDIGIGTKRSDFLALAEKRGEFAAAARAEATAKFKSHKPFSFDRKMRIPRIVSTNARPSCGGGYVATFTDVTEARRVAEKLAKAIEEAALSERRAHEVLQNERIRQKRGGDAGAAR